MSDIDKKVEYQYVLPETMVNIEISGYMLNKFQNRLIFLLTGLSQEKVKETLEKLRTDAQPENEREELTWLYLMLVNAIEKAATAQNKVVVKQSTPEELIAAFNASNQS